MRFKLGLVVGVGVGYFVATRAGRERIEQIERARRGLDDQLVRGAPGAYQPGHPSLN